MLEKILDKNVWDFLKSDGKPIVVYGMGDGAEKIIKILCEKGIDISDIFASDQFVRGHSFLGYKVLKYSDVCEKYDDFNIVMAFAIHDEPMLNRIKEINQEHRVFAPDVPVCGDGIFTREYVQENEKMFDLVFSMLEDEQSKENYLDILRFKISGRVEYLFRSQSKKMLVYSDILNLGDNEAIVDLGAYDGDTVREFLNYTNGRYKRILAVEPDSKNFKKLLKNTVDLENIQCLNIGAWKEKDTLTFSKKAGRNSKLSSVGVEIQVDKIDNFVDFKPTLIKMDIEGSELNALVGGENTIKAYLPKLYICAYHRNEDMFKLPLKIRKLSHKYKIYFRHSPYIPAWESNFYCIAD